MRPVDRRRFLTIAAGAGLLGCAASEPEEEAQAEGQTFSKPLGAQLYTLRRTLSDNPAQVLQDLAAIGYEEVEALQADFNQMRPHIEAAGLKPTSLHLHSSLVTGNWGDQQKPAQTTVAAVAENVAPAGVAWLVQPYLRQEDRGAELDAYKRLAAKLNDAGEAAAQAGLRFAYHNHAFEFEPMGESSPLETLLAETDPERVKLELDVFWVSIAGLDPAETVRRYGERVRLVHLKDAAAGAPQQYKEGVDAQHFKEVGAGELDFAAILAACEEIGVERYFVEQDQTLGDPLASLRQSYENIRSLAV